MSDSPVPVREAATVVVAREPQGGGLELLMLERSSRSVFVPSVWVFPGGGVDPADSAEDLTGVCRGITPESADSDLDTPGALRFWVAAIRESFEEAGILFGHGPHGSAPGPDIMARAGHPIDSGDFTALVTEHCLELDAGALSYLGRFVTPPGSPRRFDARFFLAEVPPSQSPVHDGVEISSMTWIGTREALERHAGGTFPLITPTLAIIQRLDSLGSLSAAQLRARHGVDRRIRIIPDEAGPERIRFPGDAGYDEASTEIEFGWVRI